MNLEITYANSEAGLNQENRLQALKKTDIKVFDEVIKFLYHNIGYSDTLDLKKKIIITIKGYIITSLWIDVLNLNKEFDDYRKYDLRKWCVEQALKNTNQDTLKLTKEIYDFIRE